MIGCSTAGEIDQTEIHDESITVAVVQFERTRVRQRFERGKVRLVSFGSTCEFHSPDPGERRIPHPREGSVVIYRRGA